MSGSDGGRVVKQKKRCGWIENVFTSIVFSVKMRMHLCLALLLQGKAVLIESRVPRMLRVSPAPSAVDAPKSIAVARARPRNKLRSRHLPSLGFCHHQSLR